MEGVGVTSRVRVDTKEGVLCVRATSPRWIARAGGFLTRKGLVKKKRAKNSSKPKVRSKLFNFTHGPYFFVITGCWAFASKAGTRVATTHNREQPTRKVHQGSGAAPLVGGGEAQACGAHCSASPMRGSGRCCTRDPPALDLLHLAAWDPKQGTADLGLDHRSGALHLGEKKV